MSRDFVRFCAGVALAAVVCSGCRKRAEEAGKSEAEAGAAGLEAAKQMAAAAAAVQQAGAAGKTVEPVDFRKLKELLPAEMGGRKRTDATGERTGAFGMSVSKAEGQYSGDEGASYTLEITDLGGMPQISAAAQFGWAAADVDRETETGYERTVSIGEHRGYEKYDSESRSGTIQVLVKGRMLVKVDGRDVDGDAVKAAFGKLPLKDIEALVP